MRKILTHLTAIAILFIVGSVSGETIFEMKNLDFDGISAKGFEIDKAGEIDIEAVGLSRFSKSQLNVYYWIINSDTRDLVWVMKSSRAKKVRGDKFLRKVVATEFLEKGRYELYAYTAESSNIRINNPVDLFKNFGDWLDGDFDDDDNRYDYEVKIEECYIKINSNELTSRNLSKFDVTGELANSLINFTRIRNNEYIEQAFSLDKEMNLRIYSLIESPKGNSDPVDRAWIMDAKTMKQVWTADRWNSERAGGGRKNRLFNDDVSLKRGDYILYYATDGSHSYKDFNVAPPYDPFNWGVTLLPGENFDRSSFHLTEMAERQKPLVDLTRARNNDYLEQGFELEKPMTFEVVAIGEASLSDRDMADFGWIVYAKTGETIWEQTYRNSSYAGGAEKNRSYDGLIELKAGQYMAYYITDGSHSYRKWNSDRPYNPRSYGLAIYPSDDFNESYFKLIDAIDIDEQEGVLVKMVRLGNNEDESESFELDKRTKVRIYSLGEGTNGRMHDYCWITDDNNDDVIWEMTWRKTKPAGGADKNRKFNGTIVLDEGSYTVHYESDGSHSFGNWNASRPRDALNWGVTLAIDESKLSNR